MDKNRQEPFTIETVGGEVNSKNPLGLAAAFLENAYKLVITLGKGGDEAAKRLFSNNYEKIARDNRPVYVLNASSGTQSSKDRNYRDKGPVKKMSKEWFNWVCKTIEKLKERILATIPVFSKKIAMGAMIAFTTASIFAGGLGRNAEQSLQERYSSLNPTFGKNWETTISVNAANMGVASNYVESFTLAFIHSAIAEYEKGHGPLPENFNRDRFAQDYYGAMLANDNNSIIMKDKNGGVVITIADEERKGVFKQLDRLFAELDKLLEEQSKNKDKDKKQKIDGGDGPEPPDPQKTSLKNGSSDRDDSSNQANAISGGPGPAGPDPAAVKQLIQFNNGQINPDNTVTFRYQATSFNQARTDATNYFQLFISACSLNGLTPTAKDLGDLTRALNGMKVTQNGSGYVAEVVVSDSFLNTVLKGLDSNNAKVPTQHNTSRNSKTGHLR